MENQHDGPGNEVAVGEVKRSPMKSAVKKYEVKKVSDSINLTFRVLPSMQTEPVVQIAQCARK